jgi:hypothetical protein
MIILLNGAPRSGKNILAEGMQQASPGQVELISFAQILKESVHRALEIEDGRSEHGYAPHNFLENCKDDPMESLFHKTPRDVYIAYSEQFIKPLFGSSYFGHLLAEKIGRYTNDVHYIITDSGFIEEAMPLVNRYGADNFVKINVIRDGTDFSMDSRSLWSGEALGIREVVFHNNSDIDLDDEEAVTALGSKALSMI